MTDPASLLPNNATPWETAQELTDVKRVLDYDVDIIRRTKNANEVDEKLLPLLAWERSVPEGLWWEGQSKTSRRYITDNSFELHRQIGTYTGLKRHAELAGAEVLRIDSPPMMAFPGRDWTTEERDAWLARFPQLRTFMYRHLGSLAGALFLDDQNPWALSDVIDNSAKFMVEINELETYGRRTFLVDHGVETPITMWTRNVTYTDRTVEEYDWLVLPGTSDIIWFMDQMKGDYYLIDSDPIAERTISVYRDTKDYKDNNEFFTSRTVSPGLAPIRIKPVHVLEPGVASYADTFLDQPTNSEGWLTEGSADLHVFDQLYLYEPGRGLVPTPPEARCFLDVTYYQWPAYKSLLKARVTLTLPSCAVVEFLDGYMLEPDMEPYYRLLDAARAASSARDSTLVDTQTLDEVQCSENLFCGQAVCGQQIPI